MARTAPSSGTSSAGVPLTSTTSAPTNHPTASPSSERAGTMALTTRWIGMNASSSVHHQCRQRGGDHGPDTVSTAASMPIQRGSSRNWSNTVRSRSERSKCHCGAARRVPVNDSATMAISAAAAYGPSMRHWRPRIRPIRIMNGNARIARPYTR